MPNTLAVCIIICMVLSLLLPSILSRLVIKLRIDTVKSKIFPVKILNIKSHRDSSKENFQKADTGTVEHTVRNSQKARSSAKVHFTLHPQKVQYTSISKRRGYAKNCSEISDEETSAIAIKKISIVENTNFESDDKSVQQFIDNKLPSHDEILVDEELSKVQITAISDDFSENSTIQAGNIIREICEVEALTPVYFGTAQYEYGNFIREKSEEEKYCASGIASLPDKIDSRDAVFIDEHYENFNDDSVENSISVLKDEHRGDFFPDTTISENTDAENTDTVVDNDSENTSTVSGKARAKAITELMVEHASAVSRSGRGGFNPESDAKISATKYRFRQRSVALLLLAVVLSFVYGFFINQQLISYIICVSSLVSLIVYLTYLRHMVRLEQSIRNARHERFMRMQEERARLQELKVMRRQGMVIVDIDDEDPIFDHLEYHPEIDYYCMPRYSEEKVAG